MKTKTIFGAIAVLVVATVATFNIGLSPKTNSMSDVMLANVEALARESGNDIYCSTDCTLEWCGCIEFGGYYFYLQECE